ncbi:sulfate ABC transporter permease subunit CysT [Bosea sp. 117]|uniref:sulfate ABC transporter permease subunit CysT n=1 Tax=Bosea sp. 117 TaxID=1125973 RepID=UPI00049459FD|nr:sulfate ABC transporter permease subunit CysT [Bosea sp. 117]
MSRVIPGFPLSFGITLLYLSLIVLLPLGALVWTALDIGWERYIAIMTGARTASAFRVTFLTAFGATAFNAVYGLALAWVLVRYDFPGKRLLDALVDVPFALPTAVAGIALSALLAKNGWFGAPLAQLGISVAYTPLGIAVAMAFTSLPFVVRTVQPVLEDLAADVEEAAATLGASDARIFARVIFPAILPAFATGCALGFARSLGEFGAIIFIAGNLPLKTEVVSLLTFIRIEEYDYPAAAAIAATLLGIAFALLLTINMLQLWQQRRMGTAD